MYVIKEKINREILLQHAPALQKKLSFETCPDGEIP
jgi:hypothetical protein